MFRFSVALVLATVAFACCKKDDPYTPPPIVLPPATYGPCDTADSGVARAVKNGKDWVAAMQSREYVFSGDGKKYWLFELTTCSEEGYWRERISFARFPSEHPEGVYPLAFSIGPAPEGYAVPIAITLILDGDVGEDFYLTDTLAPGNFFAIDRWDTLARRAEGRFRVAFNVHQPQNNPNNPEQMVFHQGRFWVRLPE